MTSVTVNVDLDVHEIIESIEGLSEYEMEVLIEALDVGGYLDGLIDEGANENAFDAIATLRRKITTLGLYPDMTALDVLDYIEEAIK